VFIPYFFGGIKLDNRNIEAKISEAKKEISERSQIKKNICIDDIYHDDIKLSLNKDKCLSEIFENNVDTYPGNPAVILQNREYNYGETDSNANRLARYLREKCIHNGDKADLVLEKSGELYTSMLGIMNSGAVYVLIYPGCPNDRVKYLLENSKASLTVTSSSITGFFGLYDNSLLFDHEHDMIINKISDNRLERAEMGVIPADGVYQGFTFAFDASIERIWMAFGQGAALVPSTPKMQKASFGLGRLLNDAKVTILSCVSILLSMMPKDIPSLEGNYVVDR
jgi:non-ribosomal peptide synthetase component F